MVVATELSVPKEPGNFEYGRREGFCAPQKGSLWGSNRLGTTVACPRILLTRPAAAFGFDRRFAEYALEDRVDMLEMMAEIEVLLKLGLAEMLAHVIVG